MLIVQLLHSENNKNYSLVCIFNNNSVVFGPKIREVWNSYELDLVNYQNKCRLIRGWDDLFNKVKEHINSVSAMKLSPYYKVNRLTCSILQDRSLLITDVCFQNCINIMLCFLSSRCLRKML